MIPSFKAFTDSLTRLNQFVIDTQLDTSKRFSRSEFKEILTKTQNQKPYCYDIFRVDRGEFSLHKINELLDISESIYKGFFKVSINNNTNSNKIVNESKNIIKHEPLTTEVEINQNNIIQFDNNIPINNSFEIEMKLPGIMGMTSFDPTLFIPSLKEDFVSFGFITPLKTILKSKQFFPVYVTGPSGTGKNIGIEQVCASLKRPMLHYSITEETSEDDLIGCWTLINGNTVWKEGPVVTAARYGMILVLDEIDLATPKIMCLQSILNGDPIFIHSKGEKLIPTEGFNIIATGNTKGFGESDIYIGTQALNEAFLERFKIMFEHLFPTENTLQKLVDKKLEKFELSSPEDFEFGKNLVKFVNHLSSAYSSGAIQYYISNRRLTFIIETYAIFKDKVKALNYSLTRFPVEVAEAFLSLYAKIDEGLTLTVEEVLHQFNNKKIFEGTDEDNN